MPMTTREKVDRYLTLLRAAERLLDELDQELGEEFASELRDARANLDEADAPIMNVQLQFARRDTEAAAARFLDEDAEILAEHARTRAEDRSMMRSLVVSRAVEVDVAGERLLVALEETDELETDDPAAELAAYVERNRLEAIGRPMRVAFATIVRDDNPPRPFLAPDGSVVLLET